MRLLVLSCFFFAAILSSTVSGLETFRALIPNGFNVPSPCNRSEIWQAVGHEMAAGSGPRNPFGHDFEKMLGNFNWPVLCRMDSDGDGKSNGLELGDPDCVWVNGATPAITDPAQLSHPGICEPLNSQLCTTKNDYLRQFSSCASVFNMTDTDWCPAIASPDVKLLTLRFDETELPPLETNYFCQTFQVPADQDYHIIAFDMIIDNPAIMHHMQLFICDTPQSQARIEKSGNYSKPMECGLAPPECTSLNLGWAFGIRGRCYPDEAAMLMGKSTYRTVILQLHYNNPLKKAGYRDSSGIKVYYTAKKRPFNMAHMRNGQFDIAIPPRSPETKLVARAFASKNCSLQKLAGYPSYTITRMSFHMHKFGSHAKIVIEKANGTQIVIVDDVYHYERPNDLLWSSDSYPILEPGDNLIIECTFQTKNHKNWVRFGKSTQDEMCLAGFEVYPRPTENNFVNIANFGLIDPCSYSRSAGACNSSVEMKAIISMILDAKNSSVSLQSECNDSLNPRRCCRYLVKYNFQGYQCAYSMAYDIMDYVTGTANRTLVNSIYPQVIYCINALQSVTMEKVQMNKTWVGLQDFN